MNQPGIGKVQPLHRDGGTVRRRRVFVSDLLLDSQIGVHRHERGRSQPVRINVDMTVDELPGPQPDRLDAVVCYEGIVGVIREIVAEGHINLVETLAERIADACLTDGRVASARIRVEKLAAIADAASVGVEIERYRMGDAPESGRF
ncbi:MAG: dihydroneopterin aldolase [Acetobacterales bacterium]